MAGTTMKLWRTTMAATLVAVLTTVWAPAASAGTLTPPAGPASQGTRHSLTNIYDQLDAGTGGSVTGAFVEPTANPAPTMYSLEDIWGKLPAKDLTNGATAAQVCTGKTYWGLRDTAAVGWGTLTGTRDCNRPPQLDNALVDQTVAEDATAPYQFAAASFSDPDGDALTYTAAMCDEGALKSWIGFVAGTRTFTFTNPPNAQVGVHCVRVTASDPSSKKAYDQFSVTVTNTDDDPTLAIALPDVTAYENLALSFTFDSASFSDPDGDALTYTAAQTSGAALPAWLTFTAATRTFSGTRNITGSSANVTVNVRVTASDGAGTTASDDYTITVTNLNDPPVAVDDTATVTQNSTNNSINALSNDTDEDGDTLSLTAVDAPAHGTAWIQAGTVRYTPTTGYTGSDSITYTVGDGNNAYDVGTISITVQ